MWFLPIIAIGAIGFVFGRLWQRTERPQSSPMVGGDPNTWGPQSPPIPMLPTGEASSVDTQAGYGSTAIVGPTNQGTVVQGFDPLAPRVATFIRIAGADDSIPDSHQTAGLTGTTGTPINQSPTTPDDSTRIVEDTRPVSPVEIAPETPSLATVRSVPLATPANLFR